MAAPLSSIVERTTINTGDPALQGIAGGSAKKALYPALIPLAVGLGTLILSTMKGIAAVAWDTEQGAHGPIVLAIAVWLLIRAWPKIREVAEPGSTLLGGAALALLLPAYIVMRIVGSIVLESLTLYAILVTTLYLFVGARAMRRAWFPIAYFLFVLPPPGSLVAAATQPLRLQISQAAVSFLSLFGLSVGRTGLLIYVDQYLLEVKAACGGLNSIISLSAIGLFYAYALHNLNIRYCALLAVVTVFFAIVANFVRVIILILITHFWGDGAAQGFLHGFAGITMFVVAMLGVMTFDHFAASLRRALAGSPRSDEAGAAA
jgi:exosortase